MNSHLSPSGSQWERLLDVNLILTLSFLFFLKNREIMETLKEGSFYHIYNRGINSCDIFSVDRHMLRFISKMYYYLIPAMKIYAYCLLSNHFHLLIKIRSLQEQREIFDELKRTSNMGFHGLKFENFREYNPNLQLGHLFNSHTKFINSCLNRTGDLFEGSFKRIEINSDLYLSQIICYIHRNPIHHRITNNYEDYQFSSFIEMTTNGETLLEYRSVLDQFGSRKNFFSAHEEFKNNLGGDFLLEQE
jgi:putative transposase